MGAMKDLLITGEEILEIRGWKIVEAGGKLQVEDRKDIPVSPVFTDRIALYIWIRDNGEDR